MDPVAQELLKAPLPARLAYNWSDGTPRLVPMGFHWDGSQIVMGSSTFAPKTTVIDQQKVAVTIDTTTFTWHVLMIRGTAHAALSDGIPMEYRLATKRVLGEEAGEGWLKQAEAMQLTWVRIAVTPEWVGILDFQTRFPYQLEKGMENMAKA